MSEDNAVFDAIIKKYGKGVITKATDFVNKEVKILSWSPAIDLAIGGVPKGTVTILTGPPKCGKTISSLHLAAKAQADDPKCQVFFINIEGRIKRRDLLGIPGLDMDRFHVIGSYLIEDDEEPGKQTGRIISGEEYLDMTVELINGVPHSVVIMDSISQLLSENEVEDSVGKKQRAPMSIILSNFFKHICNVTPVNQVIVLAITHITANVSGWGKATKETGGNKAWYASDIKLECVRSEYWTGKEKESDKESDDDKICTDPPIGKKIHWLVHATATNAIPGTKFISYLRFGNGIDETKEAVDIAISVGFIRKKGAWFTLMFLENHLELIGTSEWNEEAEKSVKYQGFDKMYAALTGNPAWLKNMKLDLSKMLGI